MPVFFLILFLFLIGGVAVKTSAIIPSNFDALFQKYGKEYGVDWLLMKRIAMIESKIGLHPRVARGLLLPSDIEGSKSTDGRSWGIMQVTLTTAKWLDASATVEKLNNPEYSIKLAAKYLKYLQDFFPRTDERYWEWVVKSYNQGQGNTSKERAGTSPGYAHAYWEKYLTYTKQIT